MNNLVQFFIRLVVAIVATLEKMYTMLADRRGMVSYVVIFLVGFSDFLGLDAETMQNLADALLGLYDISAEAAVLLTVALKAILSLLAVVTVHNKLLSSWTVRQPSGLSDYKQKWIK